MCSSDLTCAGNTNWGTGWVAFQDYDNSGTQGTLDGNDKVVCAQAALKGIGSVTTTAKSVTFGRNGIVLLLNGASLGSTNAVGITFASLDSGNTNAARIVCLNRQGRITVLPGTGTCA